MKEYLNGLENMRQIFVQPAENSRCVIKVKRVGGGDECAVSPKLQNSKKDDRCCQDTSGTRLARFTASGWRVRTTQEMRTCKGYRYIRGRRRGIKTP